MIKILYFGTVPSPYQNSFWDECRKYAEVDSLYLSSNEPGHQWVGVREGFISVLEYEKSKIKAFFKLIRHLNRINPDVILIGGYKIRFFTIVVLWFLIRRKDIFLWLERPLPSGKIKNILRNVYLRITSFFVKGVLVIGNDAYNCYCSIFKVIFNLPYSFKLDSYKFTKKRSNGGMKFLFMGQYIHRKGIIELIKSFKTISQEDSFLSLAGGGELNEEVNSLISESNNIKNYGYLNYKDSPEFLVDHDVFILPSRHDGWAVVIAEAMASGLFILGTSSTSACNEYLEDTKNGLFITTEIENISEKISWCINNPKKVREGGILNQSIIENSMSNAQVSSKELINFLKEVS